MQTTDFQIHNQLASDCHHLGKLEICHILLHKNAMIPWFILVPESEKTDLFEFLRDDRNHIFDEVEFITKFINASFGNKKTNVASIGNIVPQLHIHVVGRKETDCCWPKPVWGNLTQAKEYSESQIRELQRDLLEKLSVYL